MLSFSLSTSSSQSLWVFYLKGKKQKQKTSLLSWKSCSNLDQVFHQWRINPHWPLSSCVLLWYMKWPLSTPQCNTTVQGQRLKDQKLSSPHAIGHFLSLRIYRWTGRFITARSERSWFKWDLPVAKCCFFCVLMWQIDHPWNTNLSLLSSQSDGCFSVTESSELGSEWVWI